MWRQSRNIGLRRWDEGAGMYLKHAVVPNECHPELSSVFPRHALLRENSE